MSKFELHLGECLPWLKNLSAESVDLVVTDPPYLIGSISAGDKKSKGGQWSDLMNSAAWYQSWMEACWAALKPSGYLVSFLNWRSLPVFMRATADAHIKIDSLAVWDKEWIGPAGPRQLRPTYEQILFCGKPLARVKNRSLSDIFRCRWMAGNMGKYNHPAEKPVELVRQIITETGGPGRVVVDPFMGSGTTGEAAFLAGCDFKGAEDNRIHFETAQRRLFALL